MLLNYNDLNGGAKEVRTPDLYTASVALYQLSYGPKIYNHQIYICFSYRALVRILYFPEKHYVSPIKELLF